LLFLKDLDINRSETQQHIHTASQVELVQQVCEFIGEHMDIRPTIEQLAARFYVSPAQLKKCFYDVYGESIYSHAKSYKMKSAAYELRTTTHTISEIAHSFGYDNSSKFSQAFRKVMGMSPTEYRKEMKNSKNNKIT
jgi:AraC-like DNA-binding protein